MSTPTPSVSHSNLIFRQEMGCQLPFMAVAIVLAEIAGAVIIGLGASGLFGAIGTTGFYLGITSGGALVAASTVSILCMAIPGCKKEPEIDKTECIVAEEKDTLILKTPKGTPEKETSRPVTETVPQETKQEEPQVTVQESMSSFIEDDSIIFEAPEDFDRIVNGYYSFKAAFENKRDECAFSLSPEDIELATPFMNTSFSLTKLALDNHPDLNRTLAAKDSGICRILLCCAFTYRQLRMNCVTDGKGCLNWSRKIEPSYRDAFYQPGSVQIWWRLHYNQCCELIAEKVDLKNLEFLKQWYQIDNKDKDKEKDTTALFEAGPTIDIPDWVWDEDADENEEVASLPSSPFKNSGIFSPTKSRINSPMKKSSVLDK